MGLLDRWSKKKQKEQLEEVKGEKKTDVAKVDADEKPIKKTPAKKTSVRTTAKKPVANVEKTEPKEADKTAVVSDSIIIRPLVTEKIAVMGSQNKYGFVVKRDATKMEVKRAIKRVYGVQPTAVNMINMQGKSMRFGRSMGRRSDYKKAVVTLPAGKTISVHSGV